MKKSNPIVAFCGLVAWIVVLSSGCSKDAKPSAETGTFAIIDGVPFTAAELRDTVLVRARMAELSKQAIKESQFSDWANSYAMRILPGLVQANLLEHALKARGVGPTPESDAAMLRKYNRLTKQKAKSIDGLATLFGELEPSFRKQFARESLMTAYYESCPETQASEQDIRAYYQAQTNLQARCLKITEAGWEKGRMAYAELKAGIAWEKVAQDYSEDGDIEPTNADNWKEWMTIPIGKIEPKELADAVEKLPVGNFTEPIDIDEGLAIVRLNARDGNDCSLARILIRLGRKIEMPDRDAAIREIRKEKWYNVQVRELEQARKDFKVEYLFGTNFSYKIWQSVPRGPNQKKQGKK